MYTCWYFSDAHYWSFQINSRLFTFHSTCTCILRGLFVHFTPVLYPVEQFYSCIPVRVWTTLILSKWIPPKQIFEVDNDFSPMTQPTVFKSILISWIKNSEEKLCQMPPFCAALSLYLAVSNFHFLTIKYWVD